MATNEIILRQPVLTTRIVTQRERLASLRSTQVNPASVTRWTGTEMVWLASRIRADLVAGKGGKRTLAGADFRLRTFE
jgi:hypothetical protein